jgi:hypothetical protein
MRGRKPVFFSTVLSVDPRIVVSCTLAPGTPNSATTGAKRSQILPSPTSGYCESGYGRSMVPAYRKNAAHFFRRVPSRRLGWLGGKTAPVRGGKTRRTRRRASAPGLARRRTAPLGWRGMPRGMTDANHGNWARSHPVCPLRDETRSRCQPQGGRGGIPQEATAEGNTSEMLTCGRCCARDRRK